MATKKQDRKSVFSHPVRTLSLDELKQVSGADGMHAIGYKGGGGPDNQGHQF